MSDLIHPTAIVEDGAKLGEGVQIGPFCHVGSNVELGARTVLHPHAVVTGYTVLGADCVLHPHSTMGGAPQVIGLAASPESRLVIGDRCVFREFTTVHSGSPAYGGFTRLGNDCYLMVSTHIGHDGNIGSNVVLANTASLGGHVTVEDNVMFGGMVAVHQFTRIGRNAFVGGGAILVDDVVPFGSVVGNHAKLMGLNVIGLKRHGFTRDQIKEIRQAYRAIFYGDATFKERLDIVEAQYHDSELAMEIVNFIRASEKRPICKPE